MKKVISILVAVALLAGMSVLAVTSTSAETKWTLPLDVTNANWKAESWAPAYAWGAPLANVEDTIIGESNADGTMTLKFPEGGREDMTYPHARYENAGGIVHVSEDDYVNVKLSVGDVGQTDVQWSIRMNFISNSVRLDNAIAAAIGAEQNTESGGTWVTCGGDIEFSLKVSDVAKEWLAANSNDGSYDAIWGEGGNDFLTGVVFYLLSKDRNSEVPFTIKSFTIDDAPADPTPSASEVTSDTSSVTSDASEVTSDTSSVTSDASEAASSTDSVASDASEAASGTDSVASDASEAASDASTADNSSKASTADKTNSTADTVSQVKTGESVLPVVAVAALAVVAGSVVVVNRKRK